jgi:hypothetical protein
VPPQLRSAELAYAERLFRSDQPALVARVDRAYRRNGRLILLELKTRPRHRTYASDVIELSAQRVAVEAQTKHAVDPTGYVLTVRPEEADMSVHRVALMSRAQVERPIDRRRKIIDGVVVPRYARDRKLCEHCTECRRSPHPGWGIERG